MTQINKYDADTAIQAARKKLREAEELLRPVYASSGVKEVGDEVFRIMTDIRDTEQILTSVQSTVKHSIFF